jgi:hypothetical protein
MLVVGVGSAVAEPEVRLDTMLYHDSDHVDVVSPQLTAVAPLDDGGGEISATGVVDVISAASVDVVSEATPGFTEVREEGDLRASKRFGAWLPGLHLRTSHEPDYLSNGGGVSFERRLGGPDTVLTGSLDATYDVVGRHGTAFSDWSRTLWTVAGEIGITQNLGPQTILRAVYTLTEQDGYLAKPYRYVPLFDAAGIAAATGAGVTLDLATFDRYRLSDRPPENVPATRTRHALGARVLRYLPAIDGSIRGDLRLYADDWFVASATVEVGLRAQATARWTVELISRTYFQSAAWFWQRTYVVPDDMSIPTYRTVDKDLAETFGQMGSARAAWRKGRWEIDGEVSVLYDKFVDYLFLDSRVATIAIFGLRWSP